MIAKSEGTPSLESEESKYAPLDYRLAHLGIDISLSEPKLTPGAIAQRLDLESIQVRRILQRFNVESEYLPLQNEGSQELHEHYPVYAVKFVQEERAWREWFLTLPDKMNTNQIAEAVGRSYGWTEKTLKELYPRKRRQPDQRSFMYPRDVVKRLREIIFSTPPDEDWYTVLALAKLVGKERSWILSKLESTSIQPEPRRQTATGRNFPHYPPETLSVLLDSARETPKPAGDWLTANALETATGKSRNWVHKRLSQQFSEIGELRLDDMLAERIHYPTSVLETMRQEIAELADYSEAEDWVPLSSLRHSLGVHAVTLTRMMKQIDVETETRIDKKGRLKPHFSPRTQQQLAKLVLDRLSHPEAGGWLTFTEVQKRIGRPAS